MNLELFLNTPKPASIINPVTGSELQFPSPLWEKKKTSGIFEIQSGP